MICRMPVSTVNRSAQPRKLGDDTGRDFTSIEAPQELADLACVVVHLTLLDCTIEDQQRRFKEAVRDLNFN